LFLSNAVITRRAAPTGMVGFQAIKIATQTNIGSNQNILFEHVSLNLGNAFHPQHGVFIVKSGIYVISTTILHDYQTGSDFHGAIVHQGTIVAKLVSPRSEWDQSTKTVLIQAQAGDEIWVQSIYADKNVVGGYYSTLSGFLLWELYIGLAYMCVCLLNAIWEFIIWFWELNLTIRWFYVTRCNFDTDCVWVYGNNQ